MTSREDWDQNKDIETLQTVVDSQTRTRQKIEQEQKAKTIKRKGVREQRKKIILSQEKTDQRLRSLQDRRGKEFRRVNSLAEQRNQLDSLCAQLGERLIQFKREYEGFAATLRTIEDRFSS